MAFELNAYSPEARAILLKHGGGARPMPLASGSPIQSGVAAIDKGGGAAIFPNAFQPEAALAGLYLYFSAYDAAHKIAQEIPTAEGSFWHGILHRQEPDPDNAHYWFRRAGQHPVFPALRDAAASLDFAAAQSWDPFAFIEYCESARRQHGSKHEETAMAIQLAEWQLLFDYCARPRR